MNFLKESLKNWFGYTRRERRSTFILLMIILTVILLRSVVPEQTIDLEEIALGFNEVSSSSSSISEPMGYSSKQEKPVARRERRTLLEINTCDSAAFEALPGIGPVLSARIIKYRKLIGGFVTVDQLKEVYGLPEETFNLVSSRLMVDTTAISRISINKAEFGELIRHPYFKRSEVSAIIKFRELKGRITGINEMIENNLISSETAKRMRRYLEF